MAENIQFSSKYLWINEFLKQKTNFFTLANDNHSLADSFVC